MKVRRFLFLIFVPMKMNREILRLAIPNIVSNITVPLMGLVATAIAGHWGEDSAVSIGALAIGVSIFNFIYLNCNFVRMGTSGLTAQAFGRKDYRECTNMLARALSVSLVMGLLMLLIQYPVGEVALWAMKGGEMTREYFYTRIWAVPAGILLFGFNGWFTGMQNAFFPMFTAITVNLCHILASLTFAFGLDLGIVGIAYASVVAQWTGVLLSSIMLYAKYRHLLTRINWNEVFDLRPLKTYFVINRDIIIRSMCVVGVYTFFTGVSSHMGDKNILAVNTLLMQLFTLFSYMSDGFAYAAEALTGRFVGAKEPQHLKRCIIGCIKWGMVVAILFVSVYTIWWEDLLNLFLSDKDNAVEIIATASHYIGWVILIPLAGAIPFIMDGIMVGATETHVIRNAMVSSSLCFFVIYFGLNPWLGNNALWFAFVVFMVSRGFFQYMMTNRLRHIFQKASE